MAFSESLARRIRDVIGKRRGVTEKKMFGGVGFLHQGNLLVGVWKNSLIARLGSEQAALAKDEPNVVEFDITGRPMKGWVMVEPEGIETDEQLRNWIEKSLAFVAALPPK